MADNNTAVKAPVETVEQKLARLQRENEALKAQASDETKGDMPKSVTVGITIDGKVVGTVATEYRTFKTGSKGFYVGGKVMIAGRKFQLGMNLTEIGSKPEAGLKG